MSAQQPVILDPVLRRLAEPDVRASLTALGALRQDVGITEIPLAGAVTLDTDAAGRPRVGMLLELRSAAALDALRALGAEIGSVVGDIATARVPLDAIDRLATLPLVRVHVSRTLRTEHDSSMAAIGADQVRRREGGAWTGSTGAGTIVGIVDTGIDIAHADFLDEAGRTRILGLWDHVLGGTAPAGFTYGHYCSPADIQSVIDTDNAARGASEDRVGHGTHVAGTAAGDGSAGLEPFRYAGVAPEADLLIVKAGNGGFPEDRVIDALMWLRSRGRDLGRPVVVNMSFGHQFSPHDGGTLFERIISDLAAPGFLIVISAGNDGANRTFGANPPRLIHARVQPQSLRTDTLEIVVPAYSSTNGCSNFIWASVFYDPGDRLGVTVVRPNGSSVSAAFQEIAIEAAPQGRVSVVNAFGIQIPGTAEATIEIDGCGLSAQAPATGTWRVLLTSGAELTTGQPADLYMHTTVLGQQFGLVIGTRGFDNRRVIATPGAAHRAITVGAFTTRSCWPTVEQEICYVQREEHGDIASFSSGGPTRDGRMKPEITAPGLGIVSSLSRRAQPPANRVLPGRTHWTLEGTSMAAPHVTGAIALLLQHRPALSPEDIVEVFARSARQDMFTQRTYSSPAGRPSDWWGLGKLDVPASLATVLSGGSVATVTLTPVTDTVPAGGVVQLRAETRDAAGQIVFGDVLWRSLDTDHATVDTQGRVSGRQLGSARIVAQSAAHADTSTVHVVPPATLIITGTSSADAAVDATRGDIIGVLGLELHASGPEDIHVQRMGFEVTGPDRAIRVVIIDDANGDGRFDENDHVLHQSGRGNATNGPIILEVRLDTLLLRRGTKRRIVVAIELSARPPHGSTFTVQLVPARVRTLNANSQALDRVALGNALAAAPVITTVLAADEPFALSENPVRSDRVVFNFAALPSVAAVYTLTGVRVADLTRRIRELQYTWDLTSDDGRAVVPGVYLLVFRVDSELIREKLMILAPAGGGS